MAYRRRQGMTRSATFSEDPYSPPPPPSSSLAAQAIRASAAHNSKASPTYDYTSMTSSNEGGGFWGVVARKAKTILELEEGSNLQSHHHHPPPGSKMDNPRFRKGLDAITCSLNHIGDTIGNAVDNRSADMISETRRLQARRRGEEQNQQMHATPEDQLKASRDVAMATAAKAKLLLRELKTVKADLAFAKQRCSQVEEENRMLRESREKGDNPADDDMIRLQLETLLAEKARLAHENSVYARENRFLREIIEYHQLTMQDVVCVDEGIQEITQVYPIPAVSRMHSPSPPSPASPTSPSPTPIINNTIPSQPPTPPPHVKLQGSTPH